MSHAGMLSHDFVNKGGERVTWPSLNLRKREPKLLEHQSTPLDELSFHMAWWNAQSFQGGMTALRARLTSAWVGEWEGGWV